MFGPPDFNLFKLFLAPLIVFGRYAFAALIAYSIFYLWKRCGWLYLKIQQKFPGDADFRREIGFSALTSLIFGVIAWSILGTPLRAYTQFYTDAHQYGIVYLLLSIPVSLAIHDTYFYWMHRLMHHKSMYRIVHLVHHKSVNPSPWAAYAFHPIEAVLEAGIVPILLFCLPMHPISFFAFITLMLWINVYGHLGYELFPRSFYDHPLGRWVNTSVHHNLHHERFTGNYGLYFIFWDRLMGTLREDSVEKADAVHERIKEAKQALSTQAQYPREGLIHNANH
jgi:lathosterol oxidase